MKIDAFMGQLAAINFHLGRFCTAKPLVFKPTHNFEFTFTRLAEMGGVDAPSRLLRFSTVTSAS